MNTAMKTTAFDLHRAVTCAALATLTTLGMFSLIANVMPPLVADTLVLASGHETGCAPTAQVPSATSPARQYTQSSI
jgi:hypothetical protein